MAGLVLELFNWFQGERVGALSKELFGDAEGSHATPSEVSLTWDAHPKAARQAPMDPKRAPKGPIRDAADYRQRFRACTRLRGARRAAVPVRPRGRDGSLAGAAQVLRAGRAPVPQAASLYSR